ncbi:MAG: peptidylprolyl isomerase [Melioribacteraceae bacterium]|nr:peptidylprolyl isomerase [Melioribacteraceae bacterium]
MRYTKLLFAVILSFIITSCATEHSKIVVAEFGNQKIYLGEFEKAYSKNVGGIEKAKTDSFPSYQKFMDLYINYKMKLRDGVVRGYNKDEDMQKEYIDYKINIGSTLFLERELYEPNLKQLYERRKVEFRASHIFFREDSVWTKEKIIAHAKKLIDSLNRGADFAKLARENSKDEYTASRGGDVYYFTAGRVNSPVIEDVIYSLEPNQVYQEPVYSGFGWHILKLTEKNLRRSAIKCSHILIRTEDSTGVYDTVKPYQKIKEIEEELKKGADFGDLALKYSEDPGSKNQKGDLGFFERGRMVPEFDEAAFKLKVGEVSPIVKSQYGYHLIKLTDEQKPKSYEEEKEDLREMFKRVRYKSENEKLTEKLKREFNFTLVNETIQQINQDKSDSVRITLDYKSTNFFKKYGNKPLIKLTTRTFNVDSLFSFMIKSPSYLGQFLEPKLFDRALNQYVSEILVREKALNYDKEDKEFAQLMDEYRNGMYLFKILEEEVWTKVNIDSAKTKLFWEKNKEKFTWPNRVEFKEIYVNSDSLKNVIAGLLKNGANFDTLYNRYNQRTGYENNPGFYGLVDINSNELSRKANSLKEIGQISEPFKFQDGWSIVKLIRKDSARQKTYDEAKIEAASMYQEFESKRLEEEYLTKLKNLYKPKVYYEELRKAFKN